MIRISFFIFFINFCFSQKLVGVVTTIADEPIFGATVYIDGSTIGTTTNDKGEFELNLPNSQVVNSSLVFSHVAFESVYLNQFDISKRYRIKLIEKVNNLSEVTALNSIFSRAQMMDVFKKQFIGKTTASKSCKIENENEIYFSYDKEKKMLFAYSDKPLIIKNSYLGYKIYFDLQKFELTFPFVTISDANVISSIFYGTTRFEELDNSKKTKINRSMVYKGSTLHFFRNLAANKWDLNEFVMYKNKFQVRPDTYIQTKDTLGGTLVLLNTKQQKFSFNNEFYMDLNFVFDKKEKSKIIFKTPQFFIDKFGIHSNFQEIFLVGKFSEKKVADMLPNDYVFK
jgi:hypothetical protein